MISILNRSVGRLSFTAIFGWGLTVASSASAATFNLDVGNLQLSSSNNEFLVSIDLNQAGMERPIPHFYSSSVSHIGDQATFFPRDSGELYTYDYSFMVPSQAIISKNLIYTSVIASSINSLTLMQGTSVIFTGTRKVIDFLPDGLYFEYFYPPSTLQPMTRYDLIITALGVPSSYVGVGGNIGWAQISLDVSPVPEPGTVPFFVLGFLGVAGISTRRRT